MHHSTNNGALARSLQATRASLERGIAYLTGTQHPAGSWSDFWLPVGTSDAWVTAYIGLALCAASQSPLLDKGIRGAAESSALRAAEWILGRQQRLSGWGYNSTVPPDADSTAHALSLLAHLGVKVPAEAIVFLHEHEVPGKGYRTYQWHNPDYQWTLPCADVTAAALRALYHVGEMRRADLQAHWQEMLGSTQDEHGWWTGYWWTTPNYTTGLALEVWHLSGCPPLSYPLNHHLPAIVPFDLAGSLYANSFYGNQAGRDALLARLLSLQEPDGAWPSVPMLRVPPSNTLAGSMYRTIIAQDARRLFTTASVIRAMIIACEQTISLLPQAEILLCSSRGDRESNYRHEYKLKDERVVQRSKQGETLDALVYQAARVTGFNTQSAEEVREIFATLTRESLAAPCPWPSTQLSCLAGGIPLEFSTTVGHEVKPSLRYAVEVGNPYYAPYDRACSAIAAVARTAAMLNYDDAWQRVSPAIEHLVTHSMAISDGLRFWVWSGIDHIAARMEGSRPTSLLKVYFNLLNREVGNARQRVEQALQAASIPVSDELKEVLSTLCKVGFLHEMGFGLGPGGKIACKVYYELHGWRRPLVERILEQVGIPCDTDAVCPEIPGLLLESLAARSRAGIALRIDPMSGAVRELTTAAAFLPPMLPHAETRRRVEAWINDQHWYDETYRNMSQLLLSTWEANPQILGNLHSLFTRTISSESSWTAIYLRPCLQTTERLLSAV